MTILQAFFPEKHRAFPVKSKIIDKYPAISVDTTIHRGLPHIKGTRILAIDVLRGVAQGYSLSEMRLQFKEMGVKITDKQLIEAVNFSIEWLHSVLHEKKPSKTSSR